MYVYSMFSELPSLSLRFKQVGLASGFCPCCLLSLAVLAKCPALPDDTFDAREHTTRTKVEGYLSHVCYHATSYARFFKVCRIVAPPFEFSQHIQSIHLPAVCFHLRRLFVHLPNCETFLLRLFATSVPFFQLRQVL